MQENPQGSMSLHAAALSSSEYEFSNSWFEIAAKGVWEQLIPQIKPRTILEVGSYEGASACYLIDRLGAESEIEIHCVDTWVGGIENKEGGFAAADMNLVELRFRHNLQSAIRRARKPVNLVVHKQPSDNCLATLIAENKKNYFDLIYIDGSHQAPDVLCDAVLAFRLLKVGGYLFFDDYLWSEPLPYGYDPIRCPKPAIDAFVNINIRKLQILPARLYQLYLQKISD